MHLSSPFIMDSFHLISSWKTYLYILLLVSCLFNCMGGAAVLVTSPSSSITVNSTTNSTIQPTSSTENIIPSTSFIVSISPCSPMYCLNGGMCMDAGGFAACDCLPGFYGNRCDAVAMAYKFTYRITSATFGLMTLQSNVNYFSVNIEDYAAPVTVAMTSVLRNFTRDSLWSEKEYLRSISYRFRVQSDEIIAETIVEFRRKVNTNDAATRLIDLLKIQAGDGSQSSAADDLSFTMNTNSFLVADVNECQLNSAGYCDANAACTNTEGGYSCACNKGYAGSGYRCVLDNDSIKEDELKTIYIWGGIVGVILLWMFTLACFLHRRKAKRIRKAKKRQMIEEEVGQEAGIYNNSKGNLLLDPNALPDGRRTHSFSSEGSFDKRSGSTPSLSDNRRGSGVPPGIKVPSGDRRVSSGYYSDGYSNGGRSSSQSVLNIPPQHRHGSRLSIDEQRRVSASQIPDGRPHPPVTRMSSEGNRRYSSGHAPSRRESSSTNGSGHRRSVSNGMVSIDEQRRLSASHGPIDPRKESTASSRSGQFGNHLDVPRGRGPPRRPSSAEVPTSRKSLGNIYEDRPASSHGDRSAQYRSQQGQQGLYARDRRHTVSQMDRYGSDPAYPQHMNSMPLHLHGSQPDFMGRMNHVGGMQSLSVNNLHSNSPVPLPDY